MRDAIERESRFGVETGTLYEAELTEVWAHTDKPGRTCPWDRRDTAHYVLAVVPDDDPGRHAGESWMLPSASLPAPTLGDPTSASFDQQVIDAAANRVYASSATVDAASTARYYVPALRLDADTAPLFRKVAHLDRCRALAHAEHARDGATVISVSLFFGHGGATVGAGNGIAIEVVPEDEKQG